MRVDEKKSTESVNYFIETNQKNTHQSHLLENLHENDKADIKDYMDRVFTVLTADIRDRLLRLDIPEDQKWDVIREFVNLKQSQQQKYINELENVNRVLSEQLIKRVKKMKLPKKRNRLSD